MERQTALAEAIDIVADKAKYDQCAKKLLSYKAIDAWILKSCVQEFADSDVDYISSHCLIGDAELSEHAVHQDQLHKGQQLNGNSQITTLNSESGSISEGTIYYDVRFTAVLPNTENPISLIINLEIQTDDKPGYELVTRGTYYCARMISEQHGTVFTGEHYELIRKVYSIWICPSTPECRKNGMFRYHTVEEPLSGTSYVQEGSYDLSEVIVLNLGDAAYKSDCSILNLLNTLFSPTVLPDEKKRILSESYNITMTEELESEVTDMCNLSTAIENKGRAEGRVEGRAEGRSEGFGLLSKLVKLLMSEKRYDDVEKVSDDPGYRDQLLREFKLIV